MLRRLIAGRITAMERQLGVPADYLRHMLDVSLPAFFKFLKVIPLARYRRVLPADAANLARLVALQHEDCGTCVQIGINVSKSQGLSPAVLRAALERRWDELPGDLADVCRFSDEVVKASGEEDELRERLRKRYGEEGLVELALAIASARVFPTTKRALGYAKSCSVVTAQF